MYVPMVDDVAFAWPIDAMALQWPIDAMALQLGCPGADVKWMATN
jgi:hypothetical protein